MKQIKASPFYLLVLVCAIHANAQNGWHKVPGKISSPWTDSVQPGSPLPEYPRPQMVRTDWINLNGLWDYSIVPKAADDLSTIKFGDKILVPFAVESSLSGVGKTVGKDSLLWYKKTIDIPAKFRKQTILLHFGAVDWQTTVFINGKMAATHQGGYDPFTINITPYLQRGTTQEIAIRVWDPTDDGPQPRGKQVKNPNSIWYTPVTGIWQTVWLEPVPKTYIAAYRQTPDIDKQTITIYAISSKTPCQMTRSGITVHWDGETRWQCRKYRQHCRQSFAGKKCPTLVA